MDSKPSSFCRNPRDHPGAYLVLTFILFQDGWIQGEGGAFEGPLQSPGVSFGFAPGVPDVFEDPCLELKPFVGSRHQISGKFLKRFDSPLKSTLSHKQPDGQSGFSLCIALLIAVENSVVEADGGACDHVSLEKPGFLEKCVKGKETAVGASHESAIIPPSSEFRFDERDQFVLEETKKLGGVPGLWHLIDMGGSQIGRSQGVMVGMRSSPRDADDDQRG